MGAPDAPTKDLAADLEAARQIELGSHLVTGRPVMLVVGQSGDQQFCYWAIRQGAAAAIQQYSRGGYVTIEVQMGVILDVWLDLRPVAIAIRRAELAAAGKATWPDDDLADRRAPEDAGRWVYNLDRRLTNPWGLKGPGQPTRLSLDQITKIVETELVEQIEIIPAS